jgi:hypothetical protein
MEGAGKKKMSAFLNILAGYYREISSGKKQLIDVAS